MNVLLPQTEADLDWWDDMAWVTPQYNRGRVDWAGRVLVKTLGGVEISSDEELNEYFTALEIINNWRSVHAYPLNTFQATLRGRSQKIDPGAIVAQRTKRLWSIWHKLDRFKTMQLFQMQDIAGIRAIVSNNQQVTELLHSYQASSLRHTKKVTDYIEKPRGSGYRGIHIIWRYLSDKPGAQIYNGLHLEMQLRSSIQHTWATTVETMGTLTNQALKSSLGDDKWLRFFTLMSSYLAYKEGGALVPNTPTDIGELKAELRNFTDSTNASFRLRTIGAALQQLEENVTSAPGSTYFLLELTPEADTVKITGFKANQSQEAQARYTEVERRISNDERSDAVLVSVDSISSLRRAYPNYFLDTGAFADLLEEALS